MADGTPAPAGEEPRGNAGRVPGAASPPPRAATWSIAEMATAYGVTARTLRFYEDRGLLTPERRGTRRVFHPRDRVRLELVLRGRRLGFTLDQIATIVDMYDAEPGEVGQLRYLLDQIEVRRGELVQRRADIERTLVELAAVEARCREELARLAVTPVTPAKTPARA